MVVIIKSLTNDPNSLHLVPHPFISPQKTIKTEVECLENLPVKGAQCNILTFNFARVSVKVIQPNFAAFFRGALDFLIQTAVVLRGKVDVSIGDNPEKGVWVF
jgi:hypothetical protein